MTACEIISNLWLGDIRSARSQLFFDENNIKVVLNCSKDIPFYSNYTENIRISVHDNLEKEEIDRLYKYFPKAVELINNKLLESKGILVHCYAGKQRSATVIAAYLMKYGNLSRKDAIQTIQSKRLISFTPLVNFDKALKLYENDLVN